MSRLKMDLQCDFCFYGYDLNNHRPKSLPCGHTLCKNCIENPELGDKCPTCKQGLGLKGSKGLPDNIIVIQLLEQMTKPGQREDPQMEQLQNAVDAGRKMVQQLRQMVPQAVEALNHLIDSSATQVRQLGEALEQLQREAAGGDGATLVVAEEHLQMGAQMVEGLSLLTANKCSVLAERAQGGAAWKASVQRGPPDHMLCSLLLLQLQKSGRLETADGDNSPAPFVGPPGTSVLTIGEEDLDGGNLKVDEILRDVQRWKLARCLKDVKGADSEKLLRVMAPQLEELQFTVDKTGEVGPCVMEEVQAMKALRRLKVRCKENEEGNPDLPLQLEELYINYPNENQLRCVQRMPRLRSLEVIDYKGPEVLFPPSQHGGLLWLNVGLNMAHQTTMLSLIRAHAASLQELRIYCAAEDNVPAGWYFPDLGELLAASGLVSLRRLVLLRLEHKCTATHACLLQRRAIRDLLLPHPVDVTCIVCKLTC